MAEPMHRASRTEGGAGDHFLSSLYCKFHWFESVWSMVEQIKFQSLQLRNVLMRTLWRKNTENPSQKKPQIIWKLIFLDYSSKCKSLRSTYGFGYMKFPRSLSLPAWELPGCNGKHRQAQEPDPAVLNLETAREVTETKTLVTGKWVLNKSFWIRREFDITGDN